MATDTFALRREACLVAGASPVSPRRPLLYSYRRRIALALVALLALGGIAACGHGDRAATATSAAKDVPGDSLLADDFGDRVPARAYERIVSLNPTTTELLFTIGAGARVVGRTQYDVWPAAAKQVPSLGGGIRPNVEAVLAAHPDLVIMYAAEDNRAAANALVRADVPVFALKIDRIADFRRAATALGRLTGREAAARATTDSVERTLERVRTATAALAKPRVLWFLWDNPPLVLGAGSYQSELLAIAGGANVYGDRPEPAAQVSLEDLMARDPEVILADPGADVTVTSSPRWRGVRAVRDGRVLAIDDTILNRPGVTLGMAALSLARALHPGWSAP